MRRLVNNQFTIFSFIGRLIFFFILFYFSYRAIFVLSQPEYFFVRFQYPPPDLYFYTLNALVHEAGHFVFMLFGTFLHVLGGTVSEFILPVLLLIYFIRDLKYIGVLFCLWWIGYILVTVSVYMKDALIQQLPFLVGDTNDWFYIFNRLGILKHTFLIGNIALVSGVILIIFSLIGYLYCLINQVQQKSERNFQF